MQKVELKSEPSLLNATNLVVGSIIGVAETAGTENMRPYPFFLCMLAFGAYLVKD
jgi:hypothetical protein